MRTVFVANCSAFLLSTGCSSDPQPTDMIVDVGEFEEMGDVADVGTGTDAREMVDLAVDAAPDAWMPPTITIAGTPETDALAEDAARCGQPAHAWLRDPGLGDVTAWGTSRNMNAAVVESLAEQEGLTIPPLLYDVEVRQFSYITQNRGQLVEATASLAVPRGLEPGDELGVVIFLHGTTGFTDACAPSDDLGGQLLAAIPATQGYLVVAPDYIGMKGLGEPSTEPSPYLVGQPTAIASLDAARALYKMTESERKGLIPSTRVGVWGISQGGHAALWVQRLAPYYARELDFVGGVAAVPTADLVGQAELALTSLTNATSNTVAMFGASAAWYGADPAEAFVPPYDVDVPTALLSDCGGDVLDGVTQLDELFTPLLLDAAAAGTLGDVTPWGCMLAESSLTTTSIVPLPSEAPLLFMVAEDDELIVPVVERAAFEQLCGQGVPLDYVECAGEGHVSANLQSFGIVFDYLASRFVGEPGGACELTAARDCSAN